MPEAETAAAPHYCGKAVLTFDELEVTKLNHGQLAEEELVVLVHLLEGVLVDANVLKLLQRDSKGWGSKG